MSEPPAQEGYAPIPGAAKCVYIGEWVRGLKDHLYIAVSIDWLLDLMDSNLEEADGVEGPITRDDVAACLKDVEIITRDGKEVILLWDVNDLINRAVEVAVKKGRAAVAMWT